MNSGTFCDRANFAQHAQHFFVGPAVQRSVERRNRRRGRAIGIHVRAAHAADRVRRTVLFVVRVQNEQNIQRMLQRRIWPIARLARAKQHVQKISRIAQLVVRVHKWHAQRVPV